MPHADIKARRTFPINVFNLAILIANVYRAENDPRFAGCHTDHHLEYYLKRAGRSTKVHITALEASLWACNMLEEAGEFFHPFGLTFDQFIKKIKLTDDYNYDKVYNIIQLKETK